MQIVDAEASTCGRSVQAIHEDCSVYVDVEGLTLHVLESSGRRGCNGHHGRVGALDRCQSRKDAISYRLSKRTLRLVFVFVMDPVTIYAKHESVDACRYNGIRAQRIHIRIGGVGSSIHLWGHQSGPRSAFCQAISAQQLL